MDIQVNGLTRKVDPVGSKYRRGLFYVRGDASIMPLFRKMEISDADLAAMAGYLTRKRP